MCDQIVVLSCIEAVDYYCESHWACISIATTEDEFVEIQRRRRRGLLQLAFADIDQRVDGYTLFDTDHAHDILDFVTRHWDKVNTLMVHCEAGLSRSPAIAAAIARLKFGEDHEFFAEPYIPNSLVYQTLLDVASGRGDYQDD